MKKKDEKFWNVISESVSLNFGDSNMLLVHIVIYFFIHLAIGGFFIIGLDLIGLEITESLGSILNAFNLNDIFWDVTAVMYIGIIVRCILQIVLPLLINYLEKRNWL